VVLKLRIGFAIQRIRQWMTLIVQKKGLSRFGHILSNQTRPFEFVLAILRQQMGDRTELGTTGKRILTLYLL